MKAGSNALALVVESNVRLVFLMLPVCVLLAVHVERLLIERRALSCELLARLCLF